MRERDTGNNELLSGKAGDYLIDSMSPEEVCVAFSRLGQAISECEVEDTERSNRERGELENQVKTLLDEVEALPARDIVRAREVLTALAQSEYRDYAAMLMPVLAEVDLQFTLPIWRDLMGDERRAVRYVAYDALKFTATAQPGLQIDFRDVLPLVDAYLQAEVAGSARDAP